MGNSWINWRFGTRHLQIGRWFVTFRVNPYWLKHKPPTWFKRYS
jgi:hypothetical protein